MSHFKREERYIVVKIKRICGETEHQLRQLIRNYEIPTEDCVVVEHDWPNYEHTWLTVQQVAEGTFEDPAAEIERLRGKLNKEIDAACEANVRLILAEQERDQLKERLTAIESAANDLFKIKHRDGSHTILTVDMNHLQSVLNNVSAEEVKS